MGIENCKGCVEVSKKKSTKSTKKVAVKKSASVKTDSVKVTTKDAFVAEIKRLRKSKWTGFSFKDLNKAIEGTELGAFTLEKKVSGKDRMVFTFLKGKSTRVTVVVFETKSGSAVMVVD